MSVFAPVRALAAVHRIATPASTWTQRVRIMRRSEPHAEYQRKELRVELRGRRRHDARRRIDGRPVHVVVPRLDVELRFVPEGHAAAEVDAEVRGRARAEDVVDRDSRRIADQPVRIADGGVADRWRRQLNLAVIDAEATEDV